jgi:hypothetical protein
MKVFCGCNSHWDPLRELLQLNFLPEASDNDGPWFCQKCDYWRWHDAEYENMMHDLKQMNQ